MSGFKTPPVPLPRAPRLRPVPNKPGVAPRPPLPNRPGRGGRRPGAGAPRGNTNSLKHGLYSRKVHLATLMLAASPELRALFVAIRRANDERRTSFAVALKDAFSAVAQDPALADSIRQLVAQRLQTALSQIQPSQP